MRANKKTFINASAFVIAVFAILLVLVISLYKYSNIRLYNFVLFLIISIGILISTIFIVSVVLVLITSSLNSSNGLKLAGIIKTSYWFSKNFLLPILYFAVNLFGLNKEQLDRFFISYNNNVVKLTQKKVENSELVLILPHCLQNQSCNFKITNNIFNCKRCGKCDIGRLADLSEKWDIRAIVVTGGTAARSVLAKTKPSAVISVACERDLSSGIKDVNGIPVIGVLNIRPNGPCFNTKVDINEIEKAIIQMTNKKVRQGISDSSIESCIN